VTTTDSLDVGNHTAAVSVARDLVLFLGRIRVGVLMVAHGKPQYDFADSVAGVGALFETPGWDSTTPLLTLPDTGHSSSWIPAPRCGGGSADEPSRITGANLLPYGEVRLDMASRRTLRG
jgi:hypothetical protein